MTRLITTGALETREIRNRISDLEGLAQKIIEGVRDRQVGASGCPDRQIPEDRELELQVAARLERPSQDAEASPPVLDAPDPDTARAVDQIYADMQAFVADLIAAAGSEAPPRLEPALELMARIARLEGAVEVLYRRAIYSAGEPSAGDLASAVISHSANVAIYALKLGCGLRYDSDPLTTLGIAGLVHDVGMALMPPEIYTKDQLDEADMELLRTHPTAGHAYLLSGGDPWGHYAQIVLQEHEREDGSGYPNGIRGDQLLEEARIIGIVETYAGLTRTRPGRGGLMPFDAVREITQTQRKAFQRRILRALLQELSAFPIGSIVRLNSGTVARVIETDGAFPLRPVVQPLQDAKGRAVHGEQRLPLAQHPILHISGVVRMEEQTDRHTASGERR